ncbi:S-layer homology domain-containing protein [Paenibacillus cellulositrophicus]|uniref:S-layer homology domain-containing protein n=1 Tax=Paenibacillus cellulositrophicus TaxID=562959 RepID=UPI003D9643A2
MLRNTLMKVLSSAALLSAIAVPAVSAETATTPFSDIAGSYAKDAINELVEKGIVNGKGDGKFDPTGKIERQDFAIILAKASGLDVSSTPTSPTFSDVPSDSYAYASVEAAVKAGLIKGQGNGTFGTGSNLSRQDMAVLFVRALGVDAQGKGSILKFSDASSISDYAKDAVAVAVGFGLFNGGTDGKFDPKGGAAREEVALVASRFFDAKEIIDSQTPPSQPDPAPTTPPEPAKPATPTPPATSVPSSSGGSSNSSGGSNGNNGGSTPSQPETSAPAVELVSSSPLNIGDPIKLISSKVGKVYLVPYAATPTSKTDLESLPDLLVSSVLYANQVTEMQTSLLTAGEYKVYFVDQEGRMSAPSDKIVLQVKDEKSLTIARVNLGSSILLGESGFVLRDTISQEPGQEIDQEPNQELDLLESRDINDLIQVKQNGDTLHISYNTDSRRFEVIANGIPLAEIEIQPTPESSVSVNPTEDGIQISPGGGTTESTEASLRFTLYSYTEEGEQGKELGKVDLPIRFDFTAPTVTGVTYQDGVITVTTDQQMGALPLVNSITYSPSGAFNGDEHFLLDNVPVIALSEDFKQLTIDITELLLNELPLNENGKFRLVISDLRDVAGNLSDKETLDVNISNVDPNPIAEGE